VSQKDDDNDTDAEEGHTKHAKSGKHKSSGKKSSRGKAKEKGEFDEKFLSKIEVRDSVVYFDNWHHFVLCH
jgi:hypothetical protein